MLPIPEANLGHTKIFEINFAMPEQIGHYNLYLSKIILFKKKVLDILTVFNINNLKYYIIYFYLCELEGTKIEQNIVNMYSPHIEDYLVSNYERMPDLIATYVFKYNLTIDTKYKTLKIDHTVFIPKNEKKYFISNNEYKYISKDNYCKSIIDFFIVKYNMDNTLVLYKDNTQYESVQIIKGLFEDGYNMYFGLNFDYKIKDGVTYGTHKSDKTIRTEASYYIKKDVYYNILNYEQFKTNQNIGENIKNFYRIITLSDPVLLLYTNPENTKYFIELHNYDLQFEMEDNRIYYFLNGAKYEVLFNHDEDTYNNFGIFKLDNEDSKKLLCIYNYKNIIMDNACINDDYKDYSFINHDFQKNDTYNKYDEIDSKYVKYYYTIIDMFDNKYIIKNEDDALSILINCLCYNSPFLLLKTINPIIQVINNYKIGTQLINSLFKLSKNAYSLILYDLLYKNVELHSYNYEHMNNLFKKYGLNIMSKIKSTDMSYTSLKISPEPDDHPIDLLNNMSSEYELFYRTIPLGTTILHAINAYERAMYAFHDPNIIIVVNPSTIFIRNPDDSDDSYGFVVAGPKLNKYKSVSYDDIPLVSSMAFKALLHNNINTFLCFIHFSK